MYYEEKIINGRWHYRTSPTDQWWLFTAVKLKRKLNETLAELAKVTAERDELQWRMDGLSK